MNVNSSNSPIADRIKNANSSNSPLATRTRFSPYTYASKLRTNTNTLELTGLNVKGR